jgi:hypothetical protein
MMVWVLLIMCSIHDSYSCVAGCERGMQDFDEGVPQVPE